MVPSLVFYWRFIGVLLCELWEMFNGIVVGIAIGVTIAGLIKALRSKFSGGDDIITGFNRDLPVTTDFVKCTPVWFCIHDKGV